MTLARLSVEAWRSVSTRTRIEVREDVVVVELAGAPAFEETTEVLIAAVAAARDAGSRKILWDVRSADMKTYDYSDSVRRAEQAQSLGLELDSLIAVLGNREQADVVSFMASVGRNRGWITQRFFDVDEAMKWLRAGGDKGHAWPLPPSDNGLV